MVQEEHSRDRPLDDPVADQPTQSTPEMREPGKRRSVWPLLIIVLAGLVLALFAWLPAELRRDVDDAATSSTTTEPPAQQQPSTTEQAAPPAVETAPVPAMPETTPQPAQ